MIARRLILVFAMAGTAYAQPHSHDMHHAQYQDWQNQASYRCCNNNDCGELPDKDVHERGANIEIKIEDQWCPVLPSHLLKVGKSPDWSRNHACILGTASGLSTCERLKCFSGKAQL